jgi:capsular polysaccharide transport system permease protein
MADEQKKRLLFLESLSSGAYNDARLTPNSESLRHSRDADRRLKDSKSPRDAEARRQPPALRPERQAEGRIKRVPIIPAGELPTFADGGDLIGSLPLTRRRSYGTWISFIICVVLPTIVAAIYYVFIASNQYVSEFRFAVTDTNSSSLPSSATSGLAALFGGATITNSSQNYLVTDYLTSMEAVKELQDKIHLEQFYSKPNIDWWSRFDVTKPVEKFLPYWQSMITANYDQVTGLATAQVRAFSPEDAYLIASQLVTMAEKLVNDIATRPQKDAVRYAENEVRHAEDTLKNIRLQMTKYRNAQSVIDPNSSVVVSNVTLAQNLRASLIQLKTELTSLRQQKINDSSPTIQVLLSRINATKSQLTNVEAQISKTTDGSQALSKVVGEYEQLDLERQFAQNMVTSTMQTLEQARATAAAQHLYITPYVRPTVPQSSTYPKRFQSIAMVAITAVLTWLFGLLLLRSIREHV